MRAYPAAVAFGLACASPAFAQTASFDFEDQYPVTGLSNVSMTQNGLTLELSRPGSTFGFVDATTLGSGVPTAYGARTLTPFEDTSDHPFLLNFSAPLSAFSVQFGDFGFDQDTYSIIGWSGLNGTGDEVFAVTGTVPYTDALFHDAFAPSTNTQFPIRSVTLSGGSPDFPQSLFYDEVVATVAAAPTAPEPASWALLLAGFGVVGLVLRGDRRRAKILSQFG
jgi:hypothetical protein